MTHRNTYAFGFDNRGHYPQRGGLAPRGGHRVVAAASVPYADNDSEYDDGRYAVDPWSVPTQMDGSADYDDYDGAPDVPPSLEMDTQNGSWPRHSSPHPAAAVARPHREIRAANRYSPQAVCTCICFFFVFPSPVCRLSIEHSYFESSYSGWGPKDLLAMSNSIPPWRLRLKRRPKRRLKQLKHLKRHEWLKLRLRHTW